MADISEQVEANIALLDAKIEATELELTELQEQQDEASSQLDEAQIQLDNYETLISDLEAAIENFQEIGDDEMVAEFTSQLEEANANHEATYAAIESLTEQQETISAALDNKVAAYDLYTRSKEEQEGYIETFVEVDDTVIENDTIDDEDFIPDDGIIEDESGDTTVDPDEEEEVLEWDEDMETTEEVPMDYLEDEDLV